MGNLGFSFNADSDYMSPAESAHFKQLREAGHISFFRTAACRVCEAAGSLDSKTLCGHGADIDPLSLVHVRTNVEPHAGSDSIRSCLTGEASGAADVQIFGNPPSVNIEESGAADIKLRG